MVGGAKRNLLPEPRRKPSPTCFIFFPWRKGFIRCTELHPMQPDCNKSCLHEPCHIQNFFFSHCLIQVLIQFCGGVCRRVWPMLVVCLLRRLTKSNAHIADITNIHTDTEVRNNANPATCGRLKWVCQKRGTSGLNPAQSRGKTQKASLLLLWGRPRPSA